VFVCLLASKKCGKRRREENDTNKPTEFDWTKKTAAESEWQWKWAFLVPFHFSARPPPCFLWQFFVVVFYRCSSLLSKQTKKKTTN
jgi:hypothetical protein